MSTPAMASLVDLGKRLLEASKKGQAEEVSMLMTSGAPFTTDWVGMKPLFEVDIITLKKVLLFNL